MRGIAIGFALAAAAIAWGCGDGGGSALPTGAGGGLAGSGAAGPNGSGAGSSAGGNGSGGDLGLTSASGGSHGGGSDCTGVLQATVRDFSQAHPDFETYGGSQAFTGIVESVLGPDDKPVYAHPAETAQTSGPGAFAQWYNDVPNVNMPFPVTIQLTEVNGSFVYENGAFFPIDGQGFGNEGNPHNFHFTTEIHATFHYQGGEQFTFTGDDDLWLFINRRLAIDLGGLHPQLSQTIDLDQLADELEITVGDTYPMDIFHAERHTTESNFRIQTTISCFAPLPE